MRRLLPGDAALSGSPVTDARDAVVEAARVLRRISAQIDEMVSRDARQFDMFGKYEERDRAIRGVITSVAALDGGKEEA